MDYETVPLLKEAGWYNMRSPVSCEMNRPIKWKTKQLHICNTNQDSVVITEEHSVTWQKQVISMSCWILQDFFMHHTKETAIKSDKHFYHLTSLLTHCELCTA